jgi:type IV pilus assembly protein PilE
MKLIKGFTLIELLVAVAIVAILAGIAYPTYQSSVLRTRRIDAAAALQELTQWLERNYTVTLSYLDSAAKPLGLPFTQTPKGGGAVQYYVLEYDPGAPPTISTFALRAVPKGSQANDKCGTLTLNHTGTKGTVNGYGKTVADCW